MERIESDCSSDSDSVLSLSYSSSSFEGNEISDAVSESSEDRGSATAVAPYLYEPEDSDSPSATEDESSEDQDESRLGNSEWCSCGHCVVMPTVVECVCCREIDQMYDLMQGSGPTAQCITEHEGFEAVCLNVWVLQTAYFAYRQQYGTRDTREWPLHEQYRFIAYRQLTGWCWGWLGRNVRVVLPSCAVMAIRNKFPSEQYAGFKYPCIDR